MMAILAGDVGLNINYLTIVMAAATTIAIVGFVAVYWSTRHSEEKDSHSLAKYEKHWTVIIIIIFVAFSVSTLAYEPYPYAHSNITPNLIVDVQARQFAWCLSENGTWGGNNCISNLQIPVGETVYFNVTSVDATHDFGVYQCSNNACTTAAILFQVQVMPGFYNSIMYQFTAPGTYYIRCLEFCGYGHYLMISQFVVNSTTTSRS